jgi:hypothetical protein
MDVGQDMRECPSRRYEMYSLFLDEVDAFVFVGGGDGVLRLGLLCHFLGKPFVAVTAFGSAARELGESFYAHLENKEHYQNLSRADCLRLGSYALAGRELYSLVTRNLRSKLVFAVWETLGRRMRVRGLIDVGVEALGRLIDRLGKVALGAVVLGLVFLLFREKLLEAYAHFVTACQRLGIC